MCVHDEQHKKSQGAGEIFGLSHGYFALWALSYLHIIYATMFAITDMMKVVKLFIFSYQDRQAMLQLNYRRISA
jgi:hypothetical protein